MDSRVGDEAVRNLVSELGSYVVRLAAIDDDGQQLRYAEDQEGRRSLDDLAVVNLQLIRRSLDAVGSILASLKYRVLDLRFERDTGTFTNRCSRADLKIIARMVGARSTWGDGAFESAKSAVRTRYDLGSRDFTKALDAIQESRELAALVGIETPLCRIEDDVAVFALERWVEAHSHRASAAESTGVDYLDRDWQAMKRHAQASRALDETIIVNLDVEQISDLEALFYTGRGSEFGEIYEVGYRHALEKNRLEKPVAYVHHLMSKTNLLDAVVAGCRIVGRPSLGERLRALRDS